METRQKKLNGILLTLLMALVTISIGYAALQSILNITTSTVQNDTDVRWNVGFVGTSTPTEDGTSSVGRSCGAATVESSSVSIAATQLSKPGDSCTYPLQIKNSGTIAAKVSEIKPVAPSGATCTLTEGTSATSAQMVCGDYTYKLVGNAAGTTHFVEEAVLEPNATITAYLIIAYTGTEVNTESVTQSNGKFTVTYAQN